MPGMMPTGPAPAIPDWYKVGWRASAGIDKPIPDDEERDRGVIAMYLSEMYYGDWYHSTLAMLRCRHVLTIDAIYRCWCHFLRSCGITLHDCVPPRMGLVRRMYSHRHFIISNFVSRLFILLAFCSTYYKTSIERVRRRARDDIQRELVKSRLEQDYESADWMNNFMDRFWLIYEPVLSASIVASVDQVLSASTPAFLDSIRLGHFTLGTKAPRIDRVYTSPRTDTEIVQMVWGFSFTPNDISNMTKREADRKVNPKIVLDVRLGKGLATATMPILLEDMSFSGSMRVKLKLMANFPHVQTVEISFIKPPEFDYVLKPIGGDKFGFDVANVSSELVSFLGSV